MCSGDNTQVLTQMFPDMLPPSAAHPHGQKAPPAKHVLPMRTMFEKLEASRHVVKHTPPHLQKDPEIAKLAKNADVQRLKSREIQV